MLATKYQRASYHLPFLYLLTSLGGLPAIQAVWPWSAWGFFQQTQTDGPKSRRSLGECPARDCQGNGQKLWQTYASQDPVKCKNGL